MTDRPVCDCHGEPMYRRKDRDGWRCKVKQDSYRLKYERSPAGRRMRKQANDRYYAQPHARAEKALWDALRVRVHASY